MFNSRAIALLSITALTISPLILHAEETPEKRPAVKATEKLTEDNPPSTRLKAIPKAIPNPAKAAVRGALRVNNDFIILDGTRSKPTEANLTYQWKQTGGDNLSLPPAALSKDRVGLRIYKSGKYKFQLTVTDGKETSEPAEVEVEVVEPEIK